MYKKQATYAVKIAAQNGQLCYPVIEANTLGRAHVAWETAIFSNWEQMRRQQGFNLWRRWIAGAEESGANAYSKGEVNLVLIPGVLLCNDCERGNHLTKVVHDERGKNLLRDECRLF